ncbi:hypothetical protein JCM10369A_25740 [Nocardioides pyridinolyticus]
MTTVAGLAIAPVTLLTNALQLPPITGETAVTAAGAPTATAGSSGPKVGTTLRTSAPEWNQEGVATSYQWLRAGQPISGATGTTYLLATADLDQPVSVRATGRKDSPTAPPPATPSRRPSVTRRPRRGSRPSAGPAPSASR